MAISRWKAIRRERDGTCSCLARWPPEIRRCGAPASSTRLTRAWMEIGKINWRAERTYSFTMLCSLSFRITYRRSMVWMPIKLGNLYDVSTIKNSLIYRLLIRDEFKGIRLTRNYNETQKR